MNSQVLEAREGFTFGCDPELFVFDSNRDKFISADGLIPGTKWEPYPVEDGAVQVDGVAAEFNIDPVSTYEEFDKKIVSVMGQLEAMLPKGCKLVAKPSVVFDKDVWDATSDDSKVLGCTPDFNAWTGDVNPPPNCDAEPTLRTASGHLHIGWTKDADLSDLQHIMNCRDLVKQFDWFLGGWSLNKDKDHTRRRLYGKAGACRFKDYGVEYRVLSNFWVTNPAHRLEVWNRMQKAISDMKNNYLPTRTKNMKKTPYTLSRHDWNIELIDAINEKGLQRSFTTKFRYPIISLEDKNNAKTYKEKIISLGDQMASDVDEATFNALLQELNTLTPPTTNL